MKYLLTFFICTFFSTGILAQSWQWGIRGGGFSDGLNVLPYESVVDMTTDPNGNVYILAVIESAGNPTLESLSLNTYGNRDVLVASYTCSGTFRWKKVIGGLDDDRPISLYTDSIGHVYVCGYNLPWNRNVKFDNDFTQPNSSYKSLYLVQYDTSGVFKWLRQPAPDTMSFVNNISIMRGWDMFAAPNGNAYLFAHLAPGLLAGGGSWVVTQEGNYVITYNASGAITALTKLDMDGRPAFNSIRLSVSKSGKFIVSGTYDFFSSSSSPLFIASQQVTHAMFIVCFDRQGQLVWKRENTSTSNYNAGFMHKPILDTSFNIYVGGGGVNPGDVFNGFVFTNSLSTSVVPFVAKLDSNGNNVWMKNASANSANVGNGVALAKNKLYLIGAYPGRVLWDSYQYNSPPNTDFDISLTTFDALTGNVLKLDSLKSNFGVFDNSASIAADVRGNIYVGGLFGSQLYVNGTTLYNSGGSSDLFLAKYGSSNCSVLPLSLLSFNASLQNSNVLCNWQTASEQNTSHFIVERSSNGTDFTSLASIKAAGFSNVIRSYNYTDADAATLSVTRLWYRLKMVDMDGSFTYSNIAVVNLAPSNNIVSINPNPANISTTISYNFPAASFSKGQLDIYDITGKKIVTYALQRKGSLAIDMSNRAAGVYLVVLKQNGILVKTAKMVVSR